jgi:hypothetical protein
MAATYIRFSNQQILYGVQYFVDKALFIGHMHTLTKNHGLVKLIIAKDFATIIRFWHSAAFLYKLVLDKYVI